MKKTLIYILSLTFLLVSLSIEAQNYEITDNGSRLTVNAVIDREQINKEDSISEASGAPARIAILLPLSIKMSDAGRWQTLPDMKDIWKLTIKAPQSHGLIIRYSDFYIPQGAKLYAYNQSNISQASMYTHKDTPNGGPYSIEVSTGDSITLEYIPSNISAEKPRLTIKEIGYKYRDLLGEQYNSKTKAFNPPQNACMPNVNCIEGYHWKAQKKGVLRLRVPISGNMYMCSASLVNNTENDKTPYVLSAYHCFYRNGVMANLDDTEFYFDYETKDCANEPSPPSIKLMTGADLLVGTPTIGSSDGALLKLKNTIDPSWDVCYNGWSLENNENLIKNGVMIHHPLNDVKKISLYNISPKSANWTEAGIPSPMGTHWQITYSRGATQGGSSGCPMFDQEGYIIGTLTGGSASCSNLSESDFYGKLWYHWSQSSIETQHMSKYLDPNNKGVLKLAPLVVAGVEKPESKPYIIGYIKDNYLQIYVTENENTIKKVIVSDLFGRNVYKKTSGINSLVHDIPIAGWMNGVYVVSVDMGTKGIKTIKIIK